MKETTKNIISRCYKKSLMESKDILEVTEKLHQNLDAITDVAEEDVTRFDSIIDGVKGSLEYRKKTYPITNQITYISFTIMYIIRWLNEPENADFDVRLQVRAKSLVSDLVKIIKKSDSTLSANIRDRFGIRLILLNEIPEEEAIQKVYLIYDAIAGIIAGKNRKLRKDFITWYQNNQMIPPRDKSTIRHVLNTPFSIDFLKDFIKEPKENGYESLQFTMTIQVYSGSLGGCQFEVQLRTQKMHENAEFGSAAHSEYKTSSGDTEVEKINQIFELTEEDFEKIHIVGFNSKSDIDGFYEPKIYVDRRISKSLVPTD